MRIMWYCRLVTLLLFPPEERASSLCPLARYALRPLPVGECAFSQFCLDLFVLLFFPLLLLSCLVRLRVCTPSVRFRVRACAIFAFQRLFPLCKSWGLTSTKSLSVSLILAAYFAQAKALSISFEIPTHVPEQF